MSIRILKVIKPVELTIPGTKIDFDWLSQLPGIKPCGHYIEMTQNDSGETRMTLNLETYYFFNRICGSVKIPFETTKQLTKQYVRKQYLYVVKNNLALL